MTLSRPWARNPHRIAPMDESWRNRKTLILSRTDMMGLVTPAEYVDCVEHAFRMHGEGRFYMEPKGHIVLDKYQGEWEVMPSYIEEPEAAACKWVSIRERQPRALRPADRLLDPDLHASGDGLPARDLRRLATTRVMRTGASAAVSAKWLARKDSKVLAIVGAGHMAEGTIATCNEVFDWDEVRVWSRSQATLDGFAAAEQPLVPALRAQADDRRRAGRARRRRRRHRHARRAVPIVDDAWVAARDAHRRPRRRPGRRPGARPADPPAGARSSSTTSASAARTARSTCRSREGLITEDDVAGEIGKVICGELEGRQSDDRDHGLRLDRDRPPGLGDGAARVRACGRGRRRRREEDDLDVNEGRRSRTARSLSIAVPRNATSPERPIRFRVPDSAVVEVLECG